MKNVQSMAIGQKDSHKSLFSVWYEVLTLPRPKRQKFVNVQETSVKDLVLNTSPSARFNNVLAVVQGAGEYDKLTQGLFENYLDCKFKDPYMDGVSMATDWLCYNDLITQYIQHVQDYRLMPYLPYLSVVYHFLFASNTVPKIQYPHSMVDCNQKKTKCENLVSCMMTDISPCVRKFINVTIIVNEILPPLMEISQPTFRPVNTQLYSAKEKEDLSQLVRTMISYNLTYHQEKSPEGQYTYALEPHVDEVVKFPGLKQTRQLSYASKQLVAREIELEKMRRSELARAPTKDQEPGSKTPSKGKEVETKTPAIPNHLQRLTAKPLGKQEEAQVKDFFGRILKKTTPETKSKKSETGIKTDVLATDIWFHFQQGYSNAVRRNVKVKEFF
ncbi:chromosome transmission fidelity protein 18 homolog [Mercenaria mercenaria]|uniref:chromosome transmission fidelity protein 18 homolog n=1 Tax=Mercenaria mercenaria TaxID=6596 RepID=UPI00234F1F95|nr:chromosome transmission fidelity protein 18 homolog [Mercenaria mercenaria]